MASDKSRLLIQELDQGAVTVPNIECSKEQSINKWTKPYLTTVLVGTPTFKKEKKITQHSIIQAYNNKLLSTA